MPPDPLKVFDPWTWSLMMMYELCVAEASDTSGTSRAPSLGTPGATCHAGLA